MPIGFDSDIPDKSERGATGSGGGFTGGGGGGGVSALGGGGGGFGGFQPGGYGLQGMAGMNQPRKRYYASGNGGSTSTSPSGYAFGGPVAKPSDSITAKLTPGEFVVNRTAASDPRNAQELEQMNAEGLQNGGMQDAYSSPDGSMMHEGMEMQAPGLSREALVELLQVLLSGQEEGYGLGGWVGKHKGLLMGLGALALPFAAPALMGALGVGGAGAAAGGAAAGGAAAGSAAAGGAGMASMLGAPVAGMTNVAQGGSLIARAAQLAAAHPTLVRMGKEAAGTVAANEYEKFQNRGAEQEGESNAALSNYQNARARSEADRGYAFGGPVYNNGMGRMGWSNRFGNQQAFAQNSVAGQPVGPTTGGTGNEPWRQGYVGADPSVLNTMNEAGSRDANDYASGVYRMAQLDGADPGAAAAYRLRALAGAGRGAADRLGAYRTDMAGKDLDYRRQLGATNSQREYDLLKQSRDFEYQAKLKRIH